MRLPLLATYTALLSLIVGCSASTTSCTDCAGCCDERGQCQVGDTASACGFGGASCRACALLEACNSGICAPPVASGGGAGGGGGSAGDAGAGGGTGGGGGSDVDAGPGPLGCAGTLVQCGALCVDGLADPSNCGGCGRVCGQGQVCNRGTCMMLPTDCTTSGGCGPGLSCDPLTRQCTAGCRLVTDCPMGATCVAGACQCATMEHACGQRCVPSDVLESCGASCQACLVPAGGTATCDGTICTVTCPQGYTPMGSACADIDECATANGGCSPQAVCTNTPGSRGCACPSGFTGDGVTCTDVNECASNNGGCAVGTATCTNTPGGSSCACNSGYSGDGTACADVNECLTNNGGCVTPATCANTVGSRTCACPTGYSVSGGTTCTDINECLTSNGGCNANATCTNTPGSRSCTCRPGFTGNGITCTAQQAGESCAVAEPVTLSTVGVTTEFSTTVGFTNDHGALASCIGGTASLGPDRVFSVSLPNGVGVRATAVPPSVNGWDVLLYLVGGPASNCLATGSTCLAGANSGGAGVSETAQYTNNTGATRTVYVVIDSAVAGRSGTVTLNLLRL